MTLRESARSILPRPGPKNISAYATDLTAFAALWLWLGEQKRLLKTHYKSYGSETVVWWCKMMERGTDLGSVD